jgi:two-component system, NarL family, sensor histidine kinase UhpB
VEDPTATSSGLPSGRALPFLREAISRVGRGILGVPLFFKITVANAALAALIVWFALLHPPSREPLVGGWLPLTLGLGAVAAVAVNALLVHLALLPLRRVEATAREVERGNLAARVAGTPLADRTMARLTRVVNRMLDGLARARARQAKLSARILEAEETERKRIAYELFDDTAQLLSSVLLRLRIASRALEASEAEARNAAAAALEAARTDTLEALAGIQRIARGLRPPELDELGAAAALEAHVRQLTKGTGVRLEVSGDVVDPWLSGDSGLALYRIFQEGIANALAHGRPRTIRLAYRLEDTQVRAELEDDGLGFDPRDAMDPPERSMGILHMRERARHSGGRLTVDSTPGRGTRLVLTLPRIPSPPEAPFPPPRGRPAVQGHASGPGRSPRLS